MGHHVGHPELQELAINLLFDLTFSGAAEIVMQNATGINLVLEAIHRYQNTTSLLREAVRTLSRIYTICNSDQKKLVIRAGAIETLRQTLNNYKLNTTNNINPLNNHVAKQILSAFTLFSREEISHERKPNAILPTLIELAARKVVDAAVKYTKFSVPAELGRFLSEKKMKCSFCGEAYFEFFYEVISWEKFTEFRAPLPVFLKVCSARCFDKTKIKL